MKVIGINNTTAYKKIEKAMGNQGDPLNFLTTFHAEPLMATLTINHSSDHRCRFQDEGAKAAFDTKYPWVPVNRFCYGFGPQESYYDCKGSVSKMCMREPHQILISLAQPRIVHPTEPALLGFTCDD